MFCWVNSTEIDTQLTTRISKNFLYYFRNVNFEDFILSKNKLIITNVIDNFFRCDNHLGIPKNDDISFKSY